MVASLLCLCKVVYYFSRSLFSLSELATLDVNECVNVWMCLCLVTCSWHLSPSVPEVGSQTQDLNKAATKDKRMSYGFRNKCNSMILGARAALHFN